MSKPSDGPQVGNKLTPLSHSIIALSKAYHEYIPIMTSTLHSLVLLNGVDCILTKQKKGEVHVLPISKCDILGVVVYCHYKANGSVLMIIDDGTELCDCIGWIDAEEMDRYKVSDLVRISGAIKVLALQQKRIVNVHGVAYEGWTCSRELQVHSIEVISDKNMEAVHWLCCLQFRKRIGIQLKEMSEDEKCSMDFQRQIMNTPVLNGLETFHLLPEEEKNYIMSSRGTKDSFVQFEGDGWFFMKYYGRDCKCDMKYKETLLYCHCLATNEPLDPGFIFRDAVLTKLLEMEALVGCEKNSQGIQSHHSNLTCWKENQELQGKLEFNFATIYNDEKLQNIAKNVVAKTTHPTLNHRRLFTLTFKHLRTDGLLYLQSPDDDIYLFISKDRVLLPAILSLEVENGNWEYCRKTTGKPSNSKPSLPKFLEHGGISSAKLRIAKRLVATHRQESRG